MNWEALFNTACLALLCTASSLHLNRIHRDVPFLERVGFALIAGGALGVAASYWWPWRGADTIETIFHGGLACVAIAILQGYAREVIAALPGFSWVDRRRRT